ncbi:unnamed protein product [Prunus armeniaca]
MSIILIVIFKLLKALKSVSVTQSQPEPQTGRIQGTVVSLIRIPGSHGPSVPETREANVKRADKTEGNLDVRGHRHIRRSLLRVNWYPGASLVRFGGRTTENESLEFCQHRRDLERFLAKISISKGRDRSGKEEEAAVVRLDPVPSVGVECGGGYGGLKVTG